MQTVLYTNLFDFPVELIESYTTAKKRLLDGQSFMEVTDKKKNKMLYNKTHIAMLVCEEATGSKARLVNKPTK